MKRASSASCISISSFLHPIEMGVKPVKARREQIKLRLHPLPNLVQCRRFQIVDSRLRLLVIADYAGLAQHAQVQRHRRASDRESPSDLAGVAVSGGKQRDDLTPRRISECGEDIHACYLADWLDR